MNKYSEISKQKTEQSIGEWFVAHGDELYLLGLFFSSGSLQMHRFIIEKSKRLKGRNIYFSRDNVNPPSETFRIWNKRTWASDGSLKCVRFGGDKTIGLV